MVKKYYHTIKSFIDIDNLLSEVIDDLDNSRFVCFTGKTEYIKFKLSLMKEFGCSEKSIKIVKEYLEKTLSDGLYKL